MKTDTYRFILKRKLDSMFAQKNTVLFIMLNPSTADECVDDPTIRRCMQFALDWGFRELHVVNLFALRTTDPRGLKSAEDPIGRMQAGQDNDQYILTEALNADLVVAAWGAFGSFKNRAEEVMVNLKKLAPKVQLQCLGETKEWQPVHPLYIAKDKPLQKYDGPLSMQHP